MRTVRCRVDQFSTEWGILYGAYDTYKDFRSGWARPYHNMDSLVTIVTVPNSALCTLYKARSRRLRGPIVALALATLAAAQPYRLGDFSYVTIETGEKY